MKQSETVSMTFEDFKIEVLNDYKIACVSRECSLLGRREVLTGKAKFGIFGDGKEVPQLAMAKAFREGDFRSGYYRDQTFMMAIGHLSIQQFFAGLYGHTDIEHDPMSAGRQMGGHFSTHSLDKNGNWNDLTKIKNSSADISPTAGQMPRLLGLAQASKIYRNVGGLEQKTSFSIKGNEVAWGTIGNASTSEVLFFETINAAGVLQVPMVMSVWDDEYGISVHAKHQTTKENISEILKGFQRDENNNGYEIITVNGWDYPNLVSVYKKAAEIAREEHVPVLIHVTELTQPQGHSTSGSHERYKNEERLTWEAEFDCLKQMTKWLIENGFSTEEELDAISNQAKNEVLEGKKAAWNAFVSPLKEEQTQLVSLLREITKTSQNSSYIDQLTNELASIKEPIRKDILSTARNILRKLGSETEKNTLSKWIKESIATIQPKFSSHLYSASENNVLTIILSIINL
jgi:TPP-dependent pyruvate/acetoin dehydrogenase alpha subunit